MDNDRPQFRSVLDYLGFLAYATIVGGGVPPQGLLDVTHPSSPEVARASQRRLRLVVRNDDPAPTVLPVTFESYDIDEQISSAA